MSKKKKRPEKVQPSAKEGGKLSLFDCPEQATLREGKFFQRNIFVIFSFLVPFALMFIAFAVMGCQPFGDKQILVTDLWHQYYPFLVDFQDKLKHGESLFWSWTQGAGTNYFSRCFCVIPLSATTFRSWFSPQALRSPRSLWDIIGAKYGSIRSL